MKTAITNFVLALLVFTSCAHHDTANAGKSPEKSPSELVTEYANSHFNYTDSFSIVSIEGPDSAYSPYRRLLSCSYIASSDLTRLYQYQNAIYDGKNRKAYTDSIAMLVSDIDTIYKRIITADLDNQFPKTASEPYNRLAVRVNYLLDGRPNSQFFFYEADGLSISHCTSDNYELIKNIDKYITEFRSVYRDF